MLHERLHLLFIVVITKAWHHAFAFEDGLTNLIIRDARLKGGIAKAARGSDGVGRHAAAAVRTVATGASRGKHNGTIGTCVRLVRVLLAAATGAYSAKNTNGLP